MSSIISQIHSTPERFELVITGGGTTAIGQLLSEPGASNSVLNALVPYSFEALSDYIGTDPENACSELTARKMAARAFSNSSRWHDGSVLGIAATAALQTHRQRRGSDRIHVAVQSRQQLTTYEQNLDTFESRAEQETACAEFIIHCIAAHLGVSLDERPTPTRQVQAPLEWAELLSGQTNCVTAQPVKAILPGAFNPPHQGHRRMREVAEQQLGATVHFELSIENVDKPSLDYIDMSDRLTWLDGAPTVFTRAATFIEKSRILPGVTFVVGIDTLLRIDNAKYYGNSESEKALAIDELNQRGHKFLVFGREVDGHFQGLGDVVLTEPLRRLCVEVPESEFREDISSTKLRAETTQNY